MLSFAASQRSCAFSVHQVAEEVGAPQRRYSSSRSSNDGDGDHNMHERKSGGGKNEPGTQLFFCLLSVVAVRSLSLLLHAI